jgi:hypothetical protein
MAEIGGPDTVLVRAALATLRIGGSMSGETPVADVAVAGRAGAGLVLGWLTGVTKVASTGVTTDGSNGPVGVLGRLPPEPPLGFPGFLVGDELGLGLDDGVVDGVAVGEADGAGVVAVGEGEGTGVGEADGSGVVLGVVAVAEGVGSADGLDADGLAAADGTVSAAATPAPDQQVIAAAAPAVTAPMATRALRFAPRAVLLPAPADICPPCLDPRT